MQTSDALVIPDLLHESWTRKRDRPRLTIIFIVKRGLSLFLVRLGLLMHLLRRCRGLRCLALGWTVAVRGGRRGQLRQQGKVARVSRDQSHVAVQSPRGQLSAALPIGQGAFAD